MLMTTSMQPAVAVIDESLANQYFPGQNPIGQYLDLDNDPAQPNRRPQRRGLWEWWGM